LQQGSATAQAAQQATNTLTQIAARHQPPSPPKPEVGFDRKWARAFVFPASNTAEVLSSPDEDGKLTVRFGIMKMTVGLEDMNRWMVKSRTAVKAKPASVATPPAAAATSACNSNVPKYS